MSKKIIKFLGIFLISFFLYLPAGAVVKSCPVEKVENCSEGYIYVTVFENGKWYTYIYEEDGITLVTVIEEEW